MKPNRKSKLYARSLFTVAKKLDAISAVGESLSDLAVLVKKEPTFRGFIITHRITNEKKQSVIRSVLDGEIHPIVIEFLIVVMENKAFGLIAIVARTYRHLMAKESEVENMTIFSAVELSDAESKAIVEEIEQKSGKSLRWNSITDPSLIGGLKLRIGNVFLDGSISSRLNSLKESLLSQ
ncbi:MAG: ATP synthase F1 subunit delta [Candidatus Marinimicrobia bacterium]|nr:ATP synthase F1 subunit delta [Candidatus Neomarinimicrobiota bacterium]